ncbi:unnamed protein product [Rotaria sp. Silwood1]|nr:unnamed protein product [Rotaria sp. Silwood1]CAF3784847.1 unnamed protein product [Rotaria sp. Silwood1]CAF4751171.1 unnamed protein product [Rotaria sp. Silwood1]CAF4955715.1 unnamed protein product [Rotaria sp. Silwood1]CAF4990608.1 unnamed protein product [Rotaria sp. Silwood1]
MKKNREKDYAQLFEECFRSIRSIIQAQTIVIWLTATPFSKDARGILDETCSEKKKIFFQKTEIIYRQKTPNGRLMLNYSDNTNTFTVHYYMEHNEFVNVYFERGADFFTYKIRLATYVQNHILRALPDFEERLQRKISYFTNSLH